MTFEDRLQECIDRGMGSLGESSRHAIYWHMERTHGLKRETIAKKPQEFVKALEAMFGIGASVLETMIVREIKLTFKIPEKIESLEEAVRQAGGRMDETE